MLLEEQSRLHDRLLSNIQARMSELERLLVDIERDSEDCLYRYYHFSYKTHRIQSLTNNMAKTLRQLSPSDEGLCPLFENILKQGTGLPFELSHNAHWEEVCRPMLEAFFHARYFLQMAIKYGREYRRAPEIMDYGWAALLELYGIR